MKIPAIGPMFRTGAEVFVLEPGGETRLDLARWRIAAVEPPDLDDYGYTVWKYSLIRLDEPVPTVLDAATASDSLFTLLANESLELYRAQVLFGIPQDRLVSVYNLAEWYNDNLRTPQASGPPGPTPIFNVLDFVTYLDPDTGRKSRGTVVGVRAFVKSFESDGPRFSYELSILFEDESPLGGQVLKFLEDAVTAVPFSVIHQEKEEKRMRAQLDTYLEWIQKQLTKFKEQGLDPGVEIVVKPR